ncbi:MAG TPA: 4-(cytidine 5'-diphospho)-2-C-methyl-D-erythritol kinase [Chitinophagaceae bacterium]
MIRFPNCKINLGLRVTRKRDDGYHDLETVFYPVALKDALELVPRTEAHEIDFTLTGLPVQGDAESNLCVKAWRLLRRDFPALPAIRMHLHKRIPMGAGLGGGSADGAFTLSMLNDRFRLQLSEEQLLQYALQLGSDCPFFIRNKPSYATGRGEELQPVQLDLSSFRIAIIYPGIHINTGLAFSQIRPTQPPVSLASLIQAPVSTWRETLVNDFEIPVFREYPAIAGIKEKLYAQGAVFASMSGSGSSVFGLFPKDAAMNEIRSQAGTVFII